MLVLYLLLTLVMGGAVVIAIVRTQTEVVPGKTRNGIENKTWREWAAGREMQVNRIDTARRGDILSSDGKVLATTVSECDLYLDLGKKYKRNEKGEEIMGKGADFTGTITDSLLYASLDTMAILLSESMGKHSKDYYVELVKTERAKEHPNQCFRVEQHVPYSVWLAITRLPGWNRCVVREVNRRSVKYEVRAHIYSEMASNTVGLENGRGTGSFTGLEGAYDSILKGRNGVYNSRRLTKGIWLADTPDEGAEHQRRTDGDSVQKVVLQKRIDGQSIVSTIDTRIQDVAEDALRQTLYNFQGMAGCAVVMEVNTGYVVACANLARSVDSKGNLIMDENGRFVYNERRDWNSAVTSRYEPGSTFKTVTMMAMLNDPKLKIDTSMKVYVASGNFPYAKEVIDTHVKGKGDSLSVREVIEESSNKGMSRLGWMYYRKRRNDLMMLMRQVFPYEKLNLDVNAGVEPNAKMNDANISNDDFLRLTYGYSTAVTPMQIITFYNAIAGKGRMVKPLFCRAIIDRDGKRTEINPVVLKARAFSAESAKIMTEMLQGVVTNGTAKRVINSTVYHIAGKTGTANTNISSTGRNNSSFAGFFPAENPRYTCYVMLENVDQSAFGTQAAKVFQQISDCVMAIDERLSEDMAALAPIDSAMLRQDPVLLRGNQKDIARIYNLIGRPYRTADLGSTWVVYQSAKDGAASTYRAENPTQGRMPNCYGMSAKDAVTLLHSLGLKVRLSGYGKVTSQSPKAGSAVKKGRTVVVKLN